MKKLAVLFIAIIILLSGCTASQSRTDATYTQITQEEAKVMMDKNDGHIIVDVRRQDEYDTDPSQTNSLRSCPTSIRSFWFIAAAGAAARRLRKSWQTWDIPMFMNLAVSSTGRERL